MRRVSWFNLDKKFGFVELEERRGDAFLLVSVLKVAGYVTVPASTTLWAKVERQGSRQLCRGVRWIRLRQCPASQRRCFARKLKTPHKVAPGDQTREERMSRADVYRRNADDCRQQAERCLNPLDKERWLKVAEDWMKLAQKADDGHTRK
jgi:cold shock CspA family protein